MALIRTNGSSNLHYLGANRVENMAGVEVCTGQNEKLGAIDGFLIDRGTKRLCYFVVEPEAANERCLIPADRPAVLDIGERKLRVDAAPDEVEHVTAEPGHEVSDEDLIEATYRHSAA